LNKERYILALDQGTTSSRAILFNAQGQMLAVAQREFEQIYPRPGWVEHRAEDLWQSQIAVAREALDRAGVSAEQIAAMGITNQRETTLIWERSTGRPLHNAIVWQCRRTAADCERLCNEGHSALFQERTGLVVDAYFSGTKIKWLLDNIPEARERARRGELAAGTVDSWLIWKLTGGRLHVTDYSNASRTLLFNIHTCDWDDQLLELLDIPRQLLPEVVPSSGHLGETDRTVLGAPIPISGVAGDQQAALFGQACHSAGLAKNTYGTGSFLLMHTGASPVLSKNRLLTTIAWKIQDAEVEYALEGSVFITGAAVQWLRDGLRIIASAPETQALAEAVPDTGGVYFVPAFVGLGAPYWDSSARGAILGLSRGTTREHLARATLEAVAYQSRDVLGAMAADAGLDLAQLRVDGGMVGNDFLMQFQADILGVPVVRPEVTETTALGAAYLAGLAVNYWESQDSIAAQWRAERLFEPKLERAKAEELYNGWKRAVERTRGWAA